MEFILYKMFQEVHGDRMKKIYESFEEIAEDFKKGEAWTHTISGHTPDECVPWQKGILEFAKFLDKIELGDFLSRPEIYDELWEEI